jgi:ComF family protein
MKLWQPLLDFFLKPKCPLCNRSATSTFCIYCAQQLQADALEQPIYLHHPDYAVLAWGNYGGTLKRAITQCKYHNHPAIAWHLGDLLGQSWLEHWPSSGLPASGQLRAIPIPLHPDRQRERGFNQAELIAKGFCARTNISLDLSLKRVKQTTAQFQLTPSDRQQNLANAFQVQSSQSLKGRSVILIDDIYTTGTTVVAAMNALQTAGLGSIQVAVTAIAHRN